MSPCLVKLGLPWISSLVSPKFGLGSLCWLIWWSIESVSDPQVRNLLGDSVPGHIEDLPGISVLVRLTFSLDSSAGQVGKMLGCCPGQVWGLQ